MHRKLIMLALSCLATIVFLAAESDGQCVNGYCRQAHSAVRYAPTGPVYYYQPVLRVAVAPQPPAPAPAASPQAASDAHGFTAWLNGVRAQYGLPAVGYDGNLEAWAQQNNAQQQYRGIGHFVMGPARRQNSAMGAYQQIGGMWLSSPAHRAALLDPTIRFIGLAGAGAYRTFNAY